MNATISIPQASPALQPHVHLLRRTAVAAVRRIERLIPVNRVDIVFLTDRKSVIPHLGLGGYTPQAHLVCVYLDPWRKNFREIITRHLPRTLAHELHHAARWRKPGYGRTLFEAMITEGLADHFEIEAFGGRPAAWDRSLNERLIKVMLRRARRHFHRPDYNHSAWFFGSADQRIPEWTGYTLGFKLVADYLNEHPKSSAAKLYRVLAKEFPA